MDDANANTLKMFLQESDRVTKVVTSFLIQLQEMGLLETYQLCPSTQLSFSKDQIYALLDQIKCLKIVLLEIKSLESTIVKEDLKHQTLQYELIPNRKDKCTTDQNEDKIDDVKSQHSIDTKTHHPNEDSTFNMDLKLVDQENKKSSKLIEEIANLDRINENDNLNNSNEHVLSGVNKINPLLRKYDTLTIGENVENTVSQSLHLNAITVNVELEDNVKDNKCDFNYGESLKTPNPDFEEKKLHEASGYIEVEPPTPIPYENISKDLAEPECDKVKPMDFIREMMINDNHARKDIENPSDFIQETSSHSKDADINKDKEVDFIEDVLSGRENTTQDKPQPQEFLPQMVTDEGGTNKPADDSPTKTEDFIKEMIIGTGESMTDKTKSMNYMEKIPSDKVDKKRDEKADGFIQEMISGDTQENNAKQDDFITEIIVEDRAKEEKENYEELSKPEDKDANKEKEYPNENKSENNDKIDKDSEHTKAKEEIFSSQIQEKEQEASVPERESEEEIVTNKSNDEDKTNVNISPTRDNPNETIQDKLDSTPSITFLSEIPNVAEATNNFMNQIIDTKPKTPTQLNFMEDLNTKQGTDKPIDSKYESESLKTPKPVITEDSNYYTEEHGYSFTVLDTQSKPQSSCSLYEEGKSSDEGAKANRKPNPFGMESSDHLSFNYHSDSTGNHGNKARPSVPIHIEQNKIYERETEKDMNTFTIPSLSFFNCDNVYEEDPVTARSVKQHGYSNYTSHYSANYEGNYESNFTDYNYDYGKSGDYGHNGYQEEPYGEKPYDQKDPCGHNGSYESEGVFYNGDPSNHNTYSGYYDGNTGSYDNDRYSGSYENTEAPQYTNQDPYNHQYYEDNFQSHYSHDYNYFSEETPQTEYPACSYEHNASLNQSEGFGKAPPFENAVPVFEGTDVQFGAHNDFVAPSGYGMNFPAGDTNAPNGETTNESGLQTNAGFNSYEHGNYPAHAYTQTGYIYNSHAIGYEESNACAVASQRTYNASLHPFSAHPYQLPSNHGGEHMYDYESGVANHAYSDQVTTSGGHSMNQEACVANSTGQFSQPYASQATSGGHMRDHDYSSNEQVLHSSEYLKAYQSNKHYQPSDYPSLPQRDGTLNQTDYQTNTQASSNGGLMDHSYQTGGDRDLDYDQLMSDQGMSNVTKQGRHLEPSQSHSSQPSHSNITSQPEMSSFASPSRAENKENLGDAEFLNNLDLLSQSESRESDKAQPMRERSVERHVIEEQGESQSDLKFFETLKKFTQPPPPSAFDMLSATQQNSLKHSKSRLSKHAKKRLQHDLSNPLVQEIDGDNSTEQSLTYTQLRTPERENIEYTGDLKRLLTCSYYNEDNLMGQERVQKKSKSQLELSRELGHRMNHNEQDEKGFCCEFCGQMFMTKHSLKYHHTTLHRLNADQAFVCRK
ncbi:hypothetical protein M8J77_017856 [Diaphorina citri]|nr:hypothetical protein M8J77_017856 [Diaphorina citri]